jgi:hypothetical protein
MQRSEAAAKATRPSSSRRLVVPLKRRCTTQHIRGRTSVSSTKAPKLGNGRGPRTRSHSWISITPHFPTLISDLVPCLLAASVVALKGRFSKHANDNPVVRFRAQRYASGVLQAARGIPSFRFLHLCRNALGTLLPTGLGPDQGLPWQSPGHYKGRYWQLTRDHHDLEQYAMAAIEHIIVPHATHRLYSPKTPGAYSPPLCAENLKFPSLAPKHPSPLAV